LMVTNSITIKGLQWDSAEALHGSIPVAFFELPGGVTLTLDDCAFNTGSRIIPMAAMTTGATTGNLIIKTNEWQGHYDRMIGSNGNAAFQRAFNHSGGIMCPLHDPTAPYVNVQSKIRWIGSTNGRYLVNPTDSSFSAQYLNESMQWRTSRQQMTQATHRFEAFSGGAPNGEFRILHRNGGNVFDASSAVVAPAISGDTITMTLSGGTQDVLEIIPGDFITHFATATMAIVTAVTADGGNWDIIATQMNNMEVNINTWATTTNHMTTAALAAAGTLWYCSHCGPIITNQVSFGTFTSGSASVTNISRGDGYGGDTATYYNPLDTMQGFPAAGASNADKWPITGGTTATTIASITNGSPASMTLGGHTAVMSGDFPIYPLPIAR